MLPGSANERAATPKNRKGPACPYDFHTALIFDTCKQSSRCLWGVLADATTITCSVRRHINMQVICVRRVSARTKHGREPSACRSPDRVEDVSHRFITVWLYGNEFAT